MNPLKKAVLFAIVWALCSGALAHAQMAGNPDPALMELAGRLAEPLMNDGLKRVAVFDLHGPQKESHPAGRWLADQLSMALQMKSPSLEVIDRTKVESLAMEDEQDPSQAGKKLVKAGHALGADVVITGSYAAMGQRLGITLLTTNLTHSGKLYPSIRGSTPLSDEIRSLSSEKIPSFEGETLEAGIGGISSPKCVYCPYPEYSDQARRAHYQGNVLLEVVVTKEGRAERIVVTNSPGLGLDEKSIRAVKKWKFEPAKDLDDNPVATKVPIEVTFRLYTRQP